MHDFLNIFHKTNMLFQLPDGVRGSSSKDFSGEGCGGRLKLFEHNSVLYWIRLVCIGSNLCRLVQTCPNLIKLVQIGSNQIKLVQIDQNLSRLDQSCPNWIKKRFIGHFLSIVAKEICTTARTEEFSVLFLQHK